MGRGRLADPSRWREALGTGATVRGATATLRDALPPAMPRLSTLALLCTLLVATPALAQPAADVPIERVILFTSGVGYFEHGGRVSGASEVTLQFEEDALNDVLNPRTR